MGSHSLEPRRSILKQLYNNSNNILPQFEEFENTGNRKIDSTLSLNKMKLLILIGIILTVAVASNNGSPYFECSDTNYGKTDSTGNGCDWYDENMISCGEHDDSDFAAFSLCCGCGGGKIDTSGVL